MFWLLFMALVVGSLAASSSFQSSSIETVLDLKTKINRLTLNSANSRSKNKIDLFVASTNHLYKVVDNGRLDSAEGGLKVEIDLVTGPKLQKQQCAFITESLGSSSAASTQCIKVLTKIKIHKKYDL
jgi:hypothetical protein